MKQSATSAISALANQMEEEGKKVYNFAKGDPILPNHPILIEAAKGAIAEGHSPYAPVAGLSELRLQAANWMNERYASKFTKDETVVTTGGKFGIFASLQILLHPNDEAIIAAPYWVSYPAMVLLAKATPIIVQTRWKLTPKLLKGAITKKSRVLILNNGCNPTGVLYSREEIEELLEIAAAANLWVISDEVYSEITFDGAEFISCAFFPEHKERVVIIESCSKNFAMPGWRVGFAYGPKQLIDSIIALQSQTTTGTSYISQKVALQAIRNHKVIGAYIRQALGSRRKLFFETLHRLTGKEELAPPAGLYYFCEMENVQKILEATGVALVPGEAFGIPGYARFAFGATEDEILKGLEALYTRSTSKAPT